VTVLVGVVFGRVFFTGALAAGLGAGPAVGLLTGVAFALALFAGLFLAAGLRAGAFFAGALAAVLLAWGWVLVRVLVAMSGLRPGMGLEGAPLLVLVGEVECEGGEADGECDAVGPGHRTPAAVAGLSRAATAGHGHS
jgi:hypothetical protein